MNALARREATAERSEAAKALGAAAQRIGRAAVAALHDELALEPKPGLVSFVDSGSHDDMDARTFLRSLFALRHAFPRFAALGAAAAPLSALVGEGLQAEARMLRATAGVNTHRGAIFTLGLLCAAAGALAARGRPCSPQAVRAALVERWSAELAQRPARGDSPGGRVVRRLGLRGANAEAALGFPVLFETTVPALQAAAARGLPPRLARLEALFRTLAVLADTNLAHRGGLEGLRFAQGAARDWLRAGGADREDALAEARGLHRAFVARRLSPGGAADLLAAACWLARLEPRAAP